MQVEGQHSSSNRRDGDRRTGCLLYTSRRYAKDHRLLVWDMYDVDGGKRRACTNWTEANLMRPDHVHYLPEGLSLIHISSMCSAILTVVEDNKVDSLLDTLHKMDLQT